MKTPTYNIILAFADAATTTEIADGSGFSRTTVVNYLSQMEARGVVRKDSDNRWHNVETNVNIIRGTA